MPNYEKERHVRKLVTTMPEARLRAALVEYLIGAPDEVLDRVTFALEGHAEVVDDVAR